MFTFVQAIVTRSVHSISKAGKGYLMGKEKTWDQGTRCLSEYIGKHLRILEIYIAHLHPMKLQCSTYSRFSDHTNLYRRKFAGQ